MKDRNKKTPNWVVIDIENQSATVFTTITEAKLFTKDSEYRIKYNKSKKFLYYPAKIIKNKNRIKYGKSENLIKNS